ncbi:DUF2787 domain-containing protein [Vibrio parahaemolyticus]|nr:DUF2787 domain-containing protein [Vibrio parahaemolyticus]
MIEKVYGEFQLDDALHKTLTVELQRFSIPKHAHRVVLNCRQQSYYLTEQGLHPVEIQFKRDTPEGDWQVVCLVSFSYRDAHRQQLEPELYFHPANLWCYQPDVGSTSLAHPEVQSLFKVWAKALARHLSQRVFDEVSLSLVRSFNLS